MIEEDLKNTYFISGSGKRLVFLEMLKEIAAFIEAEPNQKYKVMIGTDSESHNGVADFVTVVAVHRVGFGGRYFFRHFHYKTLVKHRLTPKLELRKRIWEEVNDSLKLASAVIEQLQNIETFFSFELHVDVGPNGETKHMLQEVISTVRAMGYAVKVKPEAYAASTIADHHL